MASVKDELQHSDQTKEKFSSRKEKWISMVQNAVASEEEITPFNFDQRTCTKLNNIEWARGQLEEIEAVIDSEKQSEVLNRRRAKSTSNGKSNTSGSYWFTLSIIRATGLRACDTNGLSDPYVIITDVDRRIGKTQTIYENLDPIWDESFEIEKHQDSALIPLDLTIWDENSYTEDSICGKAKITLDPEQYVNFEPVEKWLEITPKGKMLVSITMECEQDDICYYFGKSLRRLMLAEREIISMIVAKFSVLVKVYISKNTVNSLLGVKGYKSMFTGILRSQNGTNDAIVLNEDSVASSLDPLFDYLNANFMTLNHNLSPELRNKVMIETWNCVLESLELLLMPPLSEKKTSQTPLNETELTIMRVWSDTLLHFFYNDGRGVPMVDLKSVKYNSFFMALTHYYYADTEELKQECSDRALESFMALMERTATPDMNRKPSTLSASSNHHHGKERINPQDLLSPSITYRNQVELTKLKRANSLVEQSKELEVLLLRMLRLRGEYEFVKRILNQKTNLAVSITSQDEIS